MGFQVVGRCRPLSKFMEFLQYLLMASVALLSQYPLTDLTTPAFPQSILCSLQYMHCNTISDVTSHHCTLVFCQSDLQCSFGLTNVHSTTWWRRHWLHASPKQPPAEDLEFTKSLGTLYTPYIRGLSERLERIYILHSTSAMSSPKLTPWSRYYCK